MKVQNIPFIFICINLLCGIDYDSHIQPIFNANCTSCHGSSGGLNLTSYDSLMAGGNSGSVISAFNAENSLLWQRVETGEMPQTGELLSEALVDIISNWINMGAESNTPPSEALLMARGNVFLGESDNQDNYGVSIIFNRYSPLPEINDTILSFQDASFYYLADSGSYNILYQIENYIPVTVSNIEISEAIVFDDIILPFCVDEYLDECGVCNGDNSTCADCSGVPNGSAVEDNFGNCCTSIDNIDDCGLCEGPGIPNGECDCNGNLLDICGVCGGVSEDLNNNGICDEDEDGMVHAWGLVSLEDTTDFSDVSIIFERYSPTIDTLVFITNTFGEFSVLIDVGIYNIHFEKNGWKTVTMSNQPLIDDLDFGTIVLETGYLVEVSGEISGIWESLNDYFVIGDITIPEGDTLTIKPGVNIYFDGMYSIISEGIIIADGEENAPILFTSNQPVPQPNDWGVIKLHSPNNVFRFVQYQYAANGIEGHNISGSIFENCTLTDLPVWPNEEGRWQCHAFEFEECNNCIFSDNVIDTPLYHAIVVESSSNNITITNNVINVYGMAIHINNPSNSIISFNNITVDKNVYGIEANNCDECVIEGNNIQVPNGSGIKSQDSDSLTIINNTLNTSQYGFYLSDGSGHLVNENTITTSSTGIYIRNGSNHIIQDNTITGTDQHAIDFDCAQNVLIESNYLYPTRNRALYNGCSNSNPQILNNIIEYNDNSNYVEAIYVINAIIQGNVIKATSGSQNYYAISGYGNTIQENEIYFYSGYSDREAINSASSDHCIIEDNYIEYSGNISAIEGSNFSIINNQIIGINNSSGYAIKHSAPDNNSVITNNTIITNGNGIKLNGAGLDLTYNLIKVGKLGVEVTNYSSGSILNNTILGSSLDEGILIRENSNMSIINNIISNFNVGVEAQTAINTITFNDFWQINSSFTAGTGIPSFVGELNSNNANGDPSDIHGNINSDPLFIDVENNNYSLKYNSPCVNAGNPTLFDPDGTMSDIGALPVYIYLVIEHEPLENTIDINGPYGVEADIYSTSSGSVSANIYYRVNSGDFSELLLVNNSGNSFSGEIPGQEMDSQIDYYIVTTDGENISTHPYNAPESLHTFNISLVGEFSNLSAISNSDGSIGLTWNIPQLYGGSFTGLQLYRSDSEGVTLGTVYADLASTAVSFIDSDLFEGETWYYRLGATIDTGDYITSIFISNETAGTSDEAGIVFVDGQVILDGVDAHDGVQVSFYNIPFMDEEATGFSDADGYYSLIISPGYYLVEWTKEGYVPAELGGYALGGDSTMATVTLIPGEVQEVSGDVSGNWTTSYQYWVMEDITVPSGETLTIDAGVKVKFSAGTGLICDGQLQVNGTADNLVIFTSREPTPNPGDWTNVQLYAENNFISYLDYEYAEDGFTGNSISGSTFDNIYMGGSLSLSADGFYFNSPSSNLTFIDNEIYVANQIIVTEDADGSTVSGNTFGTSYGGNAIEMSYCDNCSFDNNTITGQPSTGIYSYGSNNTTFSNNNLDVGNNGFICEQGDNLSFTDNTITNFNYYGIQFKSTGNAVITGNSITSDNSNDSNKYGIYNSSSQSNAVISNNTIYFPESGHNNYGIYAHDALIENNSITIETGYCDTRGIYGSGYIINNTVNIYGASCWSGSAGIWVQQYNNESSTVTGNDITYNYDSHGIYVTGEGEVEVSNNTLTGSSNNWAVYLDQANVNFHNNIISASYRGIYVTNTAAIITGNLIETSGRGVEFQSQSGTELTGNTIIVNDSTSSNPDYGVYISNLSAPIVRNNIIQGYQSGIYAEHDLINYNIMHNNLWNISGNQFEGSALPPLIGQMIDENANADTSDIYQNISMDPQFIDAGNGDYHIAFTSPCVDAGDPNLTDSNGTVSDIGAYPAVWLYAYSDASSSITLEWGASVSESLDHYDIDFRQVDEESFTDLTETTDLSFTATGLTDGIYYEFKLTEVFADGSSGSVSYAIAQAGIPQIGLSATSISVEVYEGDTADEALTISNIGGQDLEWELIIEESDSTRGGTVTFTKENYADYNDPANWDCITENVCITRRESQSIYNPLTDNSWNNNLPSGTEWAWGSTEQVLANGGYGIDGDPYTTDSRDFHRFGPYNNDNNTSYYLSDANPNNVSSMHLIEEDIYIDVTWHSWQSSGQGGGFSYTRTTPGPTWLEASSDSGILSPGSSEDINIAFDAGDTDSGNYSALITIASNDADQPELSVDVSFTVNGATRIELEAENTDFGIVYIEHESSLPLTIINDGSLTLEISNIQISGEAFSINTANLSVAAGGDTTIMVLFAPMIEGGARSNYYVFL